MSPRSAAGTLDVDRGKGVTMYWHDMAWWAWAPMTVGMVLFWGLLAWLTIRLLSGGGGDQAPPEPSARQILDARLARGEIGAGEYEQARRLLAGEPGDGQGAAGEGKTDVTPGPSPTPVGGRGR